MECSLQRDACESAFPSPFPPSVALITMNLHRRFMQTFQSVPIAHEQLLLRDKQHGYCARRLAGEFVLHVKYARPTVSVKCITMIQGLAAIGRVSQLRYIALSCHFSLFELSIHCGEGPLINRTLTQMAYSTGAC